jgi:tripartite-type tricarboxylate transporter receptor subunit TctC
MKALIAAIALATMLAGLTAARAGDYPSRPITIIVPFAAGGPSDVMARILTPVQGFCAETIVGVEGGNLGVRPDA